MSRRKGQASLVESYLHWSVATRICLKMGSLRYYGVSLNRFRGKKSHLSRFLAKAEKLKSNIQYFAEREKC